MVVDRKEPLVLARKLVDEHGLQSQITLREGDFNAWTRDTTMTWS